LPLIDDVERNPPDENNSENDEKRVPYVGRDGSMEAEIFRRALDVAAEAGIGQWFDCLRFRCNLIGSLEASTD